MARPRTDQLSERAEELRIAMRTMRDSGTDDCAHYRILGAWEQFLSDEWAARTIPYFIRKRRNKGKSDGIAILCNL